MGSGEATYRRGGSCPRKLTLGVKEMVQYALASQREKKTLRTYETARDVVFRTNLFCHMT